MELRRIVTYLSPAAVKACDVASARYGSSRAEVIRLAIAAGMDQAVETLARLSDVRMLGAASGSGRRGSSRRASGGGRSLDPDQAVSTLVEYGRALRDVQPEMSMQNLRSALGMHGQVIGVRLDDLDDVLDEVVGQVLGEPQVLPVADPSQPPE